MNDRERRPLWAGALTFALLAALPPVAGASGLLRRHFYWVDGASSAEVLRAQAERVDVVSPQWFAVAADGRLVGDPDTALLEVADEKRLQVMPLVANQGFDPEVARGVLEDTATADALIAALVRSCVAYGFAGIQLDFEGIAPRSRDAYASFVERLSAAMHDEGLVLSVAVGAPLAARVSEGAAETAGPDAWPESDHAAALDYERIGAAADWITLMAYDQHTEPGVPGPVAGLPWVEANARRVLEWVPAEKLLLGLPLYFRRWRGASVSEGPHAEAQAVVRAARARFELDPVQQEKVARFSQGGVANEIWLNDAETLRSRVELVRRLRLAGFSAWRLGQEDAAAWQAGPLGVQRRRPAASAR